MNYYGYHRISTKEQHLDRGLKEIEEFCFSNHYPLTKIYTDKKSGKDFDRPCYKKLKQKVLKSGDVFIVTEMDRLGRKQSDILTKCSKNSPTS